MKKIILLIVIIFLVVGAAIVFITIKNRPITDDYCRKFNPGNCPKGCKVQAECSICPAEACHIEGYEYTDDWR